MAESNADRPIWLVLLPRPPPDISLITLKVAYGPGLTEALKKGADLSKGSADTVIDIAIACEDTSQYGYSKLQSLFGLMYRLICLICTEHQIDLHYDNDVDARLVLFTYIQSTTTASPKSHNTIMDLQSLAKTDRNWQRILSLEGENAEIILRDFVRLRNEYSRHSLQEARVETLPGGITIHQNPQRNARTQDDVLHGHRSVAVGGTFDHLHAGHKLLLTMTAFVLGPGTTGGSCLTIGITGDELLKKKQYREELEDFFERQSAVQYFLLGILELMSPGHVLEKTQRATSAEPFGRELHDILKSGLIIKYVEIFDPCGPTITDEAISALVLSAETMSGGRVVNEKRNDKGWPALEIFEVDVLDIGDDETSQSDDKFQSKISSTDIRRRVHQRSVIANGNS